MGDPVPSAQEAFAFFSKYRQLREKDENGGQSARPDAAPRSILTQEEQQQRRVPPPASAADSLTNFIPVDRNKGTPSFRLRTLRTSPKNNSPDIVNPTRRLLPPPVLSSRSRITLVLDVDETLVHSSFSPKPGVSYDAHLQVPVEERIHNVYVMYRPYLQEFLNFVSERFEVVIFTASQSCYCNILIDLLDPDGKLGNLRLYREHCTCRNKSYIKDLFLLGRELSRVAIVDNSPTAYLFQQRNAIPIKSWFDDPSDQELLNLYTLLGKLANCASVYDILDPFNANGVV